MVCRGLDRDTPYAGGDSSLLRRWMGLPEGTLERSLGQVEGGIFGGGESRGRICRASGEYSPVDCHGPGRPGGGVAVEDAGSGAEEAAERDWVAVVEAVEAGSTRRRVQESIGGGT